MTDRLFGINLRDEMADCGNHSLWITRGPDQDVHVTHCALLVIGKNLRAWLVGNSKLPAAAYDSHDRIRLAALSLQENLLAHGICSGEELFSGYIIDDGDSRRCFAIVVCEPAALFQGNPHGGKVIGSHHVQHGRHEFAIRANGAALDAERRKKTVALEWERGDAAGSLHPRQSAGALQESAKEPHTLVVLRILVGRQHEQCVYENSFAAEPWVYLEHVAKAAHQQPGGHQGYQRQGNFTNDQAGLKSALSPCSLTAAAAFPQTIHRIGAGALPRWHDSE